MEKPISLEELRRQVGLSKSEWSPEFREYVERKIRDKEKAEKELLESDTEESEDEVMEKTYARYLKGLMLNEADLHGKKIVDMGSGDGEFVAALIEKGITSDVYGIDAEPGGFSEKEKYRSHFSRANFEDEPSTKEADYVFSLGAITEGVWGGEERMNMKKVLKNVVDLMKKGGEARIFPIQVPTKENPLEGLVASYLAWNKLIPEIAKDEHINWEFQPVDINIVGRDNDILLEEVLVLRK